MDSFNESENKVKAKSSLELNFFRYCDSNPSIVKFSVEPFAIPYIKPTDMKIHRYYIDGYVEFNSGNKFLVEVKSSTETKKPRKPSKLTKKSEHNYRKAIQTYLINQAKWEAATKYCEINNFTFIILTEEHLK